MANTYKLKYTAEQIDKILERADKEPLVLYYDKTASLYRGFSSNENKTLWLADPVVNADLELFNFVAPAPFAMYITPKNSKNQYILKGETGNYIEFSFATKDEAGVVKSESVDVTFNFDDLRGNTQSITQTYNSSEDVKFNVDKYLKDGENVVTVVVEGRLTNAYNSDDWKFTQISLDLTSSFNVALPRLTGESIAIPFKVVGPSSSIIEFIIDGDTENSIKYTTTYSTEETRQELQNNLEAGKHTLQMRASVQISGTTFYSNTLYFEFVVKGATGTFITLSQVFKKDVAIVSESRSNLKIYAEQYVKSEIPWGYYSGTIDNADITWKLGDETISTVSTFNSSEQTNYSPDPVKFIPTSAGDYVLSAYSGTTLLESYNVKVIGNTNGVEEAKNFLNLKLSGLGRNNEELNPAEWKYGTYSTEFTDFAWSVNQGWSSDALQVSGGAQAIINYQPLNQAAHTNGATVEVEFEVKNVNNSNAVLLDIMSESGVGIKITADKAILRSTQGNEISTQFIPNEKIKLAFIIFSTGSTDSPRMAYIMNNGVYERGMQYAETDTFTSDSTIKIGDSAGEATIRLYSIKCYSRALTKNEEFYNFIIDSGNISEKILANDILEDGTTNVSVSKMQGIIPTMLFTGDINSLLAANDKTTQRYIDVEFINPNNKSKNFKITHARMKLQGTSSLGYPRKNFKLYSGSKHEAVMYDFEGNVLPDGLYAFSEGDVPVHTWTLKADFSDSSCTHNASVARLFGDIEPLVMVNNEKVLMTPPQKVASEYKTASGVDFPYKIRTTPNALAMVAFYRQTPADDYIFMGQYTMLNDKSNDEVYGFKSIYNNGLDPYYFNGTKDKSKVLWNNNKTHCFEVLDNTNIYSTFSSTEGFWNTYVDTEGYTHQMWEKAFESRYPELEDDDTVPTRQATATSLYNFIEWMKTTIGNQTKFEAECEQHLDLYKCAAYYIYLIRFGAVDQVQKNMMWTTFDDQIWFPIRYDNDTILGLTNTGYLLYDYTIFRNTVDPDSSNGSSYCYAGHDSWLWNALEASTKFMNTVRVVDGALYESGLTYTNTCHYFDDLASDQWCERIYNDNQEYKYIEPLLEEGKDWMKFMQGKRKTHRHWWLKNRFDLCDALYVTGEYVNRSIRLIAEGTPSGSVMKFKAAKSTNFGWGINKVPLENNIAVEKGNQFTFNTNKLGRTLAKGDPVYIYCSNNIEEADFSELAQYLSSVVNISGTYDTELGTNLKVLKIGVPLEKLNNGVLNKATDLTFSGFNTASRLEYLDIRGLSKVTNLPFMPYLSSIKTLLAKNTGLTEFTCAEGIVFDNLELPGSIETMNLSKCGWDNIDYFPTSLNHIVFQGMGERDEVKSLFLTWANYLLSNPNTNWSNKTVYIDGIDWTNVDADVIINLREKMGDNLELRGTIGVKSYRTSITGGGLENEQVRKLTLLFGEDIFNKAASPNLYITAPDSIYFYADKNTILEGESLQFHATVFSTTGDTSGLLNFVVYGVGEEHYNRHEATFNAETLGLLETQETGNPDDIDLVIKAVFVPDNGGEPSSEELKISILKRIYVNSLSISGDSSELLNSGTKIFTCSGTPALSTITGVYTSKTWTLSGEAADLGALVLSSQTEDSCTIVADSNKTEDEVTATLTVTYVDGSNRVVSSSKTLVIRNDKIAISRKTNPHLLKIFRDHGFCRKSENYLLKTECASIVSVQLQPAGKRVDQSIFYGAENLDKITSFDEFQYFTSITEINDYTFAPLTSLKSIKLPPRVTKIGEGAFGGLSNLESISLPTTLTSIGPVAFFGCIRLTNLELPELVTSIDYTSLYGSGVKSLGTKNPNVINEVGWREAGNLKFVLSTFDGDFTIPETITSIYKYCFSSCNALRQLTIGNVDILPDSKYFGKCSAVIKGDNSVNSVGWKRGTELVGVLPVVEDVVIPEGITSVGSYAVSPAVTLDVTLGTTTTGGYVYRIYRTSETTRHYHKKITLPSTVETIKDNAASGNTSITSATLGGAVSLGNNAFYQCSSLRSMLIPNTTTSIGSRCFCGCASLTSLVFASGGTELTLGSEAFSGTGVTSVSIPSTVSSIPVSCFSSCINLSSIVLPSSITSIGNSGFSNCSSLNNVSIPSNVKSLGQSCFSKCTSLTQITLNSNLELLDQNCFSGCTGLAEISIPNTTTISAGIFNGCTSLTTVNIPTSMTEIPSQAFSGCSSITAITVPSSIIRLGNSCFRGCENLSGISLPSGVLTIEASSFDGCSQLRNINIPTGVSSLGSGVFADCSSLSSITVPESITSLPANLFIRCTQLQTVNLGNKITFLGNSCFEGCSNITYIVIPKTVSTLGENAFKNCSNIRYVKINDSITSVGANCFSGCLNLSNILSYSYNPPTIGSSAWGSDTKKTGSSIAASDRYLYIPNNSKEKYISSWASLVSGCGFNVVEGFEEKNDLYIYPSKFVVFTGETVPFKVSKINQSSGESFKFKLLHEGTLCDLTDDGKYWYEGTKDEPVVLLDTNGTLTVSSTSIASEIELSIVGYNVATEEETIAHNILVTSTSLSTADSKKVITKETNPEVMSICYREGWSISPDYMYEYECKEVSKIGTAFSGSEIVTFNEFSNFTNVEFLTAKAFSGCTSLSSITIPSSVKEIAANCFYSCAGLTSIVIPNSVQQLYSNCFGSCTNLESVSLSSSLLSIGTECFRNCTKLKSITLPSSLTSMGIGAFYGCTGLKSIEIPSSLQKILDSTFNGCSGLESVTLNEGLLSIQAAAFSGCGNLKTINFPDSLTYIGSAAFSSCYSLSSSLVFSENLKEIGSSAFNYCNNAKTFSAPGIEVLGSYCFRSSPSLRSVTLSDNLTELYGCFNGCSSLTTINIPKNLKYLRSDTFSGCINLENIDLPDSLETIGNNCFSKTKIKKINLGDKINTLGEGCFSQCAELEKVNIPDKITTIPNSCFFGCTKLKEIRLPINLKSIGNECFVECPAVIDIYSKSVNTINTTEKLISSFDIKKKNITPDEIIDIVIEKTATESISFVDITTNPLWEFVEDGSMTPSNTTGTSGSSATVKMNITASDDCYLSFNWTLNRGYDDVLSIVLDDSKNILTKSSSNFNKESSQMYQQNGAEAVSISKGNHSVLFTFRKGYYSSGSIRTVEISNIVLSKEATWEYEPGTFANSGVYKILHCLNGYESLYGSTDNILGFVADVCDFTVSSSGSWYSLNDGLVITTSPAKTSLSSGDIVDLDVNNLTIPEETFGYSLYNGETLCEISNGVYQIGTQETPDITLDSVSGVLSISENNAFESYSISVVATGNTSGKTITKNFTVSGYSDSIVASSTTNPKVLNICLGRGWCTKDSTNLWKSDCAGVSSIGIAFSQSEITSFDEFEYFTGITEIPANAFSGCSDMTSIKLPENITIIKDHSFSDCSSLNCEIIIPEGVQTIEASAFEGSGITAIDLPESLNTIGNTCFNSCASLAEITSNSRIAPETKQLTFGTGETVVGNSVSGEKKLIVPVNSYGYNMNYWNVLDDAGFELQETL